MNAFFLQKKVPADKGGVRAILRVSNRALRKRNTAAVLHTRSLAKEEIVHILRLILNLRHGSSVGKVGEMKREGRWPATPLASHISL